MKVFFFFLSFSFPGFICFSISKHIIITDLPVTMLFWFYMDSVDEASASSTESIEDKSWIL